MNTYLFIEEQLVFLKTVYAFCKFEYDHSLNENSRLSEFIESIIE